MYRTKLEERVLRVWDAIKGKMYYDVRKVTGRPGCYCVMGRGYLRDPLVGFYKPNSPRGLVASEFTGYKDKRNQEIYSGDIVVYTPYYKEKGRGVVIRKEGIWFVKNISPLQELYKKVEVVGHIFKKITPEELDVYEVRKEKEYMNLPKPSPKE